MTQIPDQERVDTGNLRNYSNLRRSVSDRKVAGVAGGLGRHLNVDPTVLRVAFVVLSFFGGAGLLLYGAAWLLVPEEGRTRSVVQTSEGTRNALLAVAAVLALLLLLGDSWGGVGFPWPLLLVGIPLLLYLTSKDRTMQTQNSTGRQEGLPHPPPDPGDTTTLPPYAAAGDQQPPAPPWMPPTDPAYASPAPAPERAPGLFGVTLALLAVALGSLWLYDVAGGGVAAGAYPALALTVTGVMLLVGAWVGRAGGVILLGVVAAAALAVTSLGEPRFGDARRLDETPTSAAQVRDLYSVPAGSIHLDLSQVRDPEALDGSSIDVRANAGDIAVVVPDGVDVNVAADIAAAGEADVAGSREEGFDVHLDQHIDGGVGVPTIDLNLDLVVGSIEVRQS